ncbi:hypothetical protein CK203_085188 [Vitis vinifera]|uniref:Uncharacterized protein n=1 Tax=Vitis vinifera TaxID=29760 RepID=A0A438E0N6_VITVI|nr:hypothetical protein CK203_085188 [Vitis vinifera]
MGRSVFYGTGCLLEELRADIVDLKEMYREQINLLVNQIQKASSSTVTI